MLALPSNVERDVPRERSICKKTFNPMYAHNSHNPELSNNHIL